MLVGGVASCADRTHPALLRTIPVCICSALMLFNVRIALVCTDLVQCALLFKVWIALAPKCPLVCSSASVEHVKHMYAWPDSRRHVSRTECDRESNRVFALEATKHVHCVVTDLATLVS